MQEEIMIWQRYSDKFSMKAKESYKSFKKRIYSAKLRKRNKQKSKLTKKVESKELFQHDFSIEEKDFLKKEIGYLEDEIAKLREKMENC